MANTNQENKKPIDQAMTSTIDPSDPLYIHPSDHPELILVPKVLDGTNYAMWRRSMLVSLSAKNKLGFIKGTIPTPSEADAKHPAWQRCNDMVLSWIFNSLSQDLVNSVLYVETPSEIWADLQERFSQGDFSHHYQVERSIVELRQNQDSIFTYYTKIKTLWDELKICNPPISCTFGGMKHLNAREEKVRLGQFLFGLNESYSTVRRQIMMMQPLPTVKNVYSLLCEEEKQRGLVEHKSIDQTHAMNVKTHPPFKQQGADTQRHTDSRPRTSSSSKSQGSRKPLLCTYCDDTTHTVERCYYLIGFPIGHKLHGKDVQPPNRNQTIAANQTRTEPSRAATKPTHPSDPSIQFISEELSQIKAFFRNGKNPPCANYAGISTPICSSSTLQNSKSNNWIIDSGATNHIASSITSVSCVSTSSQVSLPNGSHAQITGVGSTHLLHNLHVKDVLCVHSFHMNLLFVSQLTSDLHCSIQFSPTFCILQDLSTKRMIGLGKQHKGLYYLVPHSELLSPATSHQVSSPSDITWHQRLGQRPLSIFVKTNALF